MRIIAVAFALLTASITTACVTNDAIAQAKSSPTMPTNDEIRSILVDRIDKQHQSVGIVVGVIDSSGRRIVSYGNLDSGDKRAVDGNTIFEIGSITKVFTSLLLADMVERKEVALTDPVSKYLPAEVKMPERNGRQITLEDLSTHTSGLPRLPSNMKPKDPANPYADYSVEQMYQFLSGYQLTRDPGSQYEYSNLGGGLLGHVLARRAGTDYGTLVRTRICEPLGMNDTRITLSPEEKARFATGYDASDPKSRTGVVVLSNAETPAGVDDIGQHLLNANAPLWQPPKEHKEVSVDPKLFDGYVGQYQLAPNFVLTVTKEGNELFVQATGQPKFQLFPEGDRDYFLKVVDAQITFNIDAQGRATELVLHQNGDHPAKRIQ